MKTESQSSENIKAKQSSPAKVKFAKAKKVSPKNTKSESSKTNPKQNTAPLHESREKGFIARGKHALDRFPKWTNRAASVMPSEVRNLELVDSAHVQNYFRDRPLMLGVLGLGLGTIVGALMPTY